MVVVPQSKLKVVVVVHSPIQVSNFPDAMDKRYIPRLDFSVLLVGIDPDFAAGDI